MFVVKTYIESPAPDLIRGRIGSWLVIEVIYCIYLINVNIASIQTLINNIRVNSGICLVIIMVKIM